jgi:uncharacterized protein YndB with AHSA1/START domain
LVALPEEVEMPDEVTRETVIDAPAEEVWEAVTDPSWLGDEGELDLRPGGEVRVGDRAGFVEEVEPGERLTFWWAAPGEESTRVEIALEEDGEATRVTVVEARPLALLEEWVAGPQLLATA